MRFLEVKIDSKLNWNSHVNATATKLMLSVMLSPLLSFITLKLLKLQIKSRLRTVSLIFNNWFTFSSMSHNYQTSFATKGNLQIPSVQTTSYGKNAFVYSVIRTWNDIQKEMKGVMFNTFSLAKLKSLLIEFYLNMYQTS